MVYKRIIFVVILMAIGLGCYTIMNQRFDPLARYPYDVNEQQKELLLTKLDSTQIAYLVSSKIEPDEIFPYIEQDNYIVNNTRWYSQAYNARKEEYSFIVKFINKYKANMEFKEVEAYIKNYSYNTLAAFFDGQDTFNKNLKLYPYADDKYAFLNKDYTLYSYEPSDLVKVENVIYDNMLGNEFIYISEEVHIPLQELISAANDPLQFQEGSFYAVAGYISYEHQVNLYKQAHANVEQVDTTWDFPGQSEYQLGKTIKLELRDIDNLSDAGKERIAWIRENAYRYGFVLRYPYDKTNITLKSGDALTFRYVGNDFAKTMNEENKVMEDTQFN